MREIKFRAWHIDSKVMVLPVSLTSANFDEDYEVMQFAGLKDKNKKEIYEGDIIKSVWCSKKEAKGEWETEINYILGVVTFGIQEFFDGGKNTPFPCFYLKLFFPNKGEDVFWISEKRKCEVIGNIYENPELIKHGALEGKGDLE